MGKISLELRRLPAEQLHQSADFLVAVKDTSAVLKHLRQKGIWVKYSYASGKLMVVHANFQQLQETIPAENIIATSRLRTAKEELALSNFDLSVNGGNAAHRVYPGITGEGINVSVKEQLPDTADIDIKGRWRTTSGAPTIFSTHATNMATIIAGAGNSFYEGYGVARGAMVSAADFNRLIPEEDAFYRRYGISVQNHSYGTGLENYYGADAAAYDASVVANPSLFHVFSVGNSGGETDTIGTYAGVPGMANITGSFKQSKNSLAVGHLDSFYHVLPASSRGPAYDGRIKPELVAFATDGSSGAAALVSGAAALLQQKYFIQEGVLPDAALVKVLLINSAADAGKPGPDYHSGFGNLQVLRALQNLDHKQYFSGTIAGAQTKVFRLTVPEGISALKLTLSWTDPPAAPLAARAIVNDLDLSVSYGGSEETWLPWVLDSHPDADLLNADAVRGRDSLNTCEQVTISFPRAGEYAVQINGNVVRENAPQSFFISYQFDTANIIRWTFPVAEDALHSGQAEVLRWYSGFGTAIGRLSFSRDSGSSWVDEPNIVELSKGYYTWITPAGNGPLLLKITAGNREFISDQVALSQPPALKVGFDCPDSVLLYWQRQPGADAYRLFHLGDKYMNGILTTADTVVVMAKDELVSNHFAVQPVFAGNAGFRSFAIDYTQQGVACYFRQLLAGVNGDLVKLELTLGTLYGLDSIIWEKRRNGRFEPIGRQPATSVEQSFTDDQPVNGANIYRVRLVLHSGKRIVSEPVTAWVVATASYLIYPNPVVQGSNVTILSKEWPAAELALYDAMGRQVLVQELNSQHTIFSTARLRNGVYYLIIRQSGKETTRLKLVVL
ncbi:S8 family peptidase [Flavihumibacter petaseus]|nr:S8 family peptidase [Flavihumibacter petaseus]